MPDGRSYNLHPPRPAWGIRAPARKGISTTRPIVVAPLPARATIPLDTALGPATPVVRAGDRVMTGQVVARHPGGQPLHASVSGRVESIASRPVPAAAPREGPCLVIGSDGRDEIAANCVPVADPLALPAGEIVARIREGGIVGLGGALYPTAGKLVTERPIEALLINGAECEPWISCDEMLIRERARAVATGARIMLRALNAPRAIFAVEADMPEARLALHEALKQLDDDRLALAVVTAKYPAGGERQLIELITGLEVPSGGLPRDIGVLCQNAATAAAVADLFDDGSPLVSRVVTVTGGAIAEPGNVLARIGTPIAELVELAGGYREPPARLIMGGPMMGFALDSDELPVTPATNCIVAALPGEVAAPRPEMPCIRCGDCIEACPARLLPQELLLAAARADVGALQALALPDCIECGCCDYVCPSSIPLTARFIAAKARLRNVASA